MLRVMKLFSRLALVGFLLVCPLATAQDTSPYVGTGFGFTFVNGSVGGALTLQGGVEHLLGPVGVQGVAVIGISVPFIEFAAELLGHFPMGSLKPYVGAGVGVSPTGAADIISPSRALALNAHAVGGLEVAVADAIGVYGEVQPRLYFDEVTSFGLGFRFGANYHFD